jgi:hypothetical protein
MNKQEFIELLLYRDDVVSVKQGSMDHHLIVELVGHDNSKTHITGGKLEVYLILIVVPHMHKITFWGGDFSDNLKELLSFELFLDSVGVIKE